MQQPKIKSESHLCIKSPCNPYRNSNMPPLITAVMNREISSMANIFACRPEIFTLSFIWSF